MDNLAHTPSTSESRLPQPRRRVDAHHHLWRYSSADYGWIGEEMASLRRDFLIKDLLAELTSAAIDVTVVVQARETLEETTWLLECAQEASLIGGVVGWAPLEDDGILDILSGLHHADKLVGLREIVQNKPDGFLDSKRFNSGVSQLKRLDLTYDLLIQERQLVEAVRFVDRHPCQQFVLDHAAKPRISKGELEPWKTNLRELGLRPNVVCKVSGLATEALWNDWTLDSLRPYLDACVEVFGPNRLMAGSDWPVSLVATGYSGWFELLRVYFQNFSSDEIGRIFGENAIDVYRLSRNVEVQS
jgi:L-fuconolactonase